MSTKNCVAMVFILTFGFNLSDSGARSASAQAKQSETAPSFTLKLLNGDEFKSSDLKGKVAVLKFVASY